MTKGKHATKPDGAWEPSQVIEYALPRIAQRDFYIVCPDNAVDSATDNARMEWSMGDVLENRPALSRWHKDYESRFAEHVKAKTGK
jgi:hypothetical protein